MMRRVGIMVLVAMGIALTVSDALAEIGLRQGVTSARNLPKPVVSASLVVLDVPHKSQGNRPWCVPTSAAMVLSYFGVRAEPAALKRAAENHKPVGRRNADFTYWDDMQVPLRQLGQRWRIKSYPRNNAGFRKGLTEIRRWLRKGRPVLIDVHLREGHTFVVMGFNDAAQVVYIRDPMLKSGQVRILSYEDLRTDWHNHRFGQSRSAFFSSP